MKEKMGLYGLFVFLALLASCGPVNQKPSVDPMQSKALCDSPVPTDASSNNGAAPVTGSEPVAFTANKHFIVSALLQGVDNGTDPNEQPTANADNVYVFRIVNGQSLAPISQKAVVVVSQVHTTDDPPTAYPLPDLKRQDDITWTATVHYGRAGTYDIHVQVGDGATPAEERILHVSFD